MLRVKYHHQNLSLKNIRSEVWKDISGLESYYQVSNYGRIKRLQYEIRYKHGAVYLKPPKIIKPTIVKHLNKFKKDYSCFLVNRVILNKKRHNFTIARLVYFSFVERFNLDDHRIVIICKDGDNFNIRPANLRKASSSERQQRTVSRNRFSSPFFNLTADFRKKIRKVVVKTVSKGVGQYSKDGIELRMYSSMAAAQRSTGIHSTAISGVASGKGKTAGGFIWKWVDKYTTCK